MNHTKIFLLGCLFGNSIQAIDVTVCNETTALIWHCSGQSKVGICVGEKSSFTINDGDRLIVENVVYTLKKERNTLNITSGSPFFNGNVKISALIANEINFREGGNFYLLAKTTDEPIR